MNKKIIIIDIETTDFLNKGGLIVEVGIVELDLTNGNRTPIYNRLVCEEGFGEEHKGAWIFSNSSLKYEDVLKAEPLDARKLQEILAKYHATAYNKKFDFDFLSSRGLGINELPCPMIALTPVCKLPGKFGKYKWPKVQEAWDILFPNVPYVEEHRGYDDALHEALLVYKLHTSGVVNYGG